MSALGGAAETFHFLRPVWLALVPIALVLWWVVRRRARAAAALPSGLAPHLRDALLLRARGGRGLQPIDGVACAIVVLSLGAAGPTWSRVPDPFVAQTAPLVIALEVTPSMTADDVAPSRLERAKQKVRDLLQMRAGARTALIAYAGTAHRVVPMTEDTDILLPYLEGLAPEIMPREGADATAALALAQTLIEAEESAASVLFVLDGLETTDVEPLRTGGSSLAVLSMLPEGVRDRGLDRLSGRTIVSVRPDASDLQALKRELNALYARSLREDETQPWDDRGWWFAWPAALLALIWFRRGWTMRWAAVAGFALVATAHNPSRADGLADWFLTPDQQGRLAYQAKDFDRAADLFADPLWKGFAQLRDGQYEVAAGTLARVETAQAAFAQGLAHIRGRQYRDGVRAFELALERDPDYPGAAENLETAKAIVTYIEDTREAEDTGEVAGIGADDIVFDNEANRGAATSIDASPQDELGGLLSADQWMAAVDTRTSDFLRQRFALEAARSAP